MPFHLTHNTSLPLTAALTKLITLPFQQITNLFTYKHISLVLFFTKYIPTIPNAYTIILSLTFFQYSQFLTSFTSKNWWPFLSHRLPWPHPSETASQLPGQTRLHQSTDLYTNATLWSLFLTTTMFTFPFLGSVTMPLMLFSPHAGHNAHTPHLAQHIMYYCFTASLYIHYPLCTIHL